MEIPDIIHDIYVCTLILVLCEDLQMDIMPTAGCIKIKLSKHVKGKRYII